METFTWLTGAFLVGVATGYWADLHRMKREYKELLFEYELLMSQRKAWREFDQAVKEGKI